MTHILLFTATVFVAFGVGQAAKSSYYNMQCIQSKCPTQLSDCHNESAFLAVEDNDDKPNENDVAIKENNGNFLHTHTNSECDTLLQCIVTEEKDEQKANDVSVCTDGITSRFSMVEKSLHDCADENKCIEEKESAKASLAQANSEVALSISSISPQCIRDSCVEQFVECGNDPECKTVAECLEMHLEDGHTTACTQHIRNLDESENGILGCARKNQCIHEEAKAEKAASFLQLTPENISGPPSSLFQTGSRVATGNLRVSQDKEVKKAEAAWEQSRKKTDSLLSKVHEEMAKLNEDLSKTSKQQKHDLALLQESREKENKQLEETEKKLQDMAKKVVKNPKSSFLQTMKTDDSALFAPLRHAAEAARKFAADIKKQATEFQGMQHLSPSSFLDALKKMKMKPSSFIENKSLAKEKFEPIPSVNTEKADKSLSLAQQSLAKLNQDLAQQRKQLAEQEANLKKEEKKIDSAGITKPKSLVGSDGKPIFSFADLPLTEHEASFLQLQSLDTSELPGFGGAKDPLSPEALQDWREKFEEKLRKAREVARAGLPRNEASSFLQEPSDFSSGQWPPASYNEAQENVKRGQREVERMQNQFNEGMQKLKQENSQLLAEAKGQLQKDREMQENLEAEKARRQAASSSLLQTGAKRGFDAAKEEEHIKELERKWKREAAKITSSGENRLNQLDTEQNSLIEQAKEKEEQQNAQLDELRQKLDGDLAKLHKDVATANARAKQHKSEVNSMIDSKLNTDAGTNFLQVDEKTPGSDVSVTPDADLDTALASGTSASGPPLKKADEDDSAYNQRVLRYWEQQLAATNAQTQAEADALGAGTASSFLETTPDMSADEALSKAEADLKKLQEQLQSKAPTAMFAETKRNVDKLFANAKDVADQPLPDDFKLADDGALAPPPAEAGGLNNLFSSFTQKDIKAH